MSDQEIAVAPPTADAITIDVGTEQIKLETGEIGRLANGAVLLTAGETVLYATACCSSQPVGDGSFVPLQVNYQERFSAAGRTSGGYLKRDGRPKDGEVLTARLVDRPLRPMFAPAWAHDTQVLIWVLSYDGVHSPEPLAITAAAAALCISDIPLQKAVAGVRVGLLEGRGFVVNPSEAEQAASSLDLVLAGTADALLMIEGYCDFLSEEQMIEAIEAGAAAVAAQCRGIEAWAARAGKPKRAAAPPSLAALEAAVARLAGPDLEASYRNAAAKQDRTAAAIAIQERVKAQLVGELERQPRAVPAPDASPAAAADAPSILDGADIDDEDVNSVAANNGASSSSNGAGAPPPPAAAPGGPGSLHAGHGQLFSQAWKKVETGVMRRMAVEEDRRADGRRRDEVRPITCRAGLLPATHGSALFTRGQTQTIAVATLGPEADAQRVDEMAEGENAARRFFLQYYFPPSCVGEVGRVGSPGRREIGHGQLAERALMPVIPPGEEFPYTIRLESTVTESNGSSSMASVCSGYLALRDAGVPVRRPVAGVAMGLLLEAGGRFAVLTDILGSEDAMGDMDFKVAGDATHITAFQMDIKVEGITVEVLAAALAAARTARGHILEKMAACDPAPRGALAPNAPHIVRFLVAPDRIGLLIGPGGRTIRGLKEASGADEIQVIDNVTGLLEVVAGSAEVAQKARSLVELQLEEPTAGKVYRGARVAAVEKFGLFVEVLIEPAQAAITLPVTQHMHVLGGRGARVASVEKFGLFVEVLPGKQGLVHSSELDVDRGVQMDSFSAGDAIDVKLLEVLDNGKLKLSRKAVQLEEGRTETGTREEPEVGKIYRNCTVTGVATYGVFAAIMPGYESLVHVSELELSSRGETDGWSVGDKMDIKVLEVMANGKMKLSRKAVLLEDAGQGSEAGSLQEEAALSRASSVASASTRDSTDIDSAYEPDEPASTSAVAAEPEELVVGRIYRDRRVDGVSDFGVFVEVIPGVTGLVHVSELNHGFTTDVRSEWAAGDRIDVKLLKVLDKGRLSLSRKAVLLDDGDQ